MEPSNDPEQKGRILKLTEEELFQLALYLDLTDSFRRESIETWENLSSETNDDGTPRYKHAAGNASFFRKQCAIIEQIRQKIEALH